MSEIAPADFDATFKSLEGLTRTQIAELVGRHLSSEDAESFAVLAASLSLDALRFHSARVLLRAQWSPTALGWPPSCAPMGQVRA